ncbi:type II secretion system major pseudopilin GspG [Vitiosangium sp. GDMCC 1.1324]|uniref:type II secretion system major pseudopilin GspG n=1 Tax=Vitiosangium sp. (strain GDMCC 1.1324) TaxID=2138576 RepID=UPI000D384B21|nr:type II secretion system major pseudopilin GspG [Vitiosangium sp. GDMCC 1.1324]PTL80433.1 type II secretion system protein GspG [Vitiosangium sp. GDMCC 1.1324]
MSDKKTKQQRRRRGMTLIEIMVVITILGLIMAAVGVAVIPKLDEAKQDTARLDIANIHNALKLYYTKKGKYPDTGTGLRALVETQNLEKIPQDPWGHEYVYMNEGGKPVIISYGADGTQGGEGPDSDISSKDAAAQK